MRIDIVTTFVEMFTGPFNESILKRAQQSSLVDIRIWNLRDWTEGPHHKTDDEPYGGGEGMVMLAKPLIDAVQAIQSQSDSSAHVIFTTPQGRKFDQTRAEELSRMERLLILCGHYKGVDERVIDYLHPEEISIGDYVLTGGELPAMVIVDAVVRLIPGVVNSYGSVEKDSFSCGLLDCPQYTRPRSVYGLDVPEVLVNGNHAEIARWRLQTSLERTAQRRPDLYRQYTNQSEAAERNGGLPL